MGNIIIDDYTEHCNLLERLVMLEESLNRVHSADLKNAINAYISTVSSYYTQVYSKKD